MPCFRTAREPRIVLTLLGDCEKEKMMNIQQRLYCSSQSLKHFPTPELNNTLTKKIANEKDIQRVILDFCLNSLLRNSHQKEDEGRILPPTGFLFLEPLLGSIHQQMSTENILCPVKSSMKFKLVRM